MIKRYTMNKLMIVSMSIILLLIFSIYKKDNISYEIEYPLNNENIIYLLDKDNYVSQVISYYDTKNIKEEVEKRLNILINGEDNLNDFNTTIPKNTKINKIEIKEDNIYIDFSSHIKEINPYIEEKMIESIIYTLTEINGINNVYLSIDNKEYKYLKNGKELNYPLNREYGINKLYELTDLNDINKVTTYFIKEINDYKYYVPVTKVSNQKDDKIDIIIHELKSSTYSQNKLNSYIENNLEVLSYDINDNVLNIIFNDYIFDTNTQTVLEEVKYTITESIFDNYDVERVVFNTKKQKKLLIVDKKSE